MNCSGSFVVPYKIEDWLFYFNKKWHWNFVKDCTESVDCFGLYEHFNNTNISNQWEHGIASHLSVSSLISFISVIVFNVYHIFYLLGYMYFKNFILSGAIVNDFCLQQFIIPLSNNSLLVHKIINFCVLIFVSCNFTNLLIALTGFFFFLDGV